MENNITKPSSWQERFDELFVSPKPFEDTLYSIRPEVIKSFISEELEKAKEEERLKLFQADSFLKQVSGADNLPELLKKAREEGRHEVDNFYAKNEPEIRAKIRQEEQDRILKIIDGVKDDKPHENYLDGYNQALEDIKSKIRD